MPTPKYQPNCTLYLCAGTGLDYNNSIWMHKFAYPYTTDPLDTSWWNALFQFIKAHSIAEGYWYLTDTRPHSGVIRVGRAPLLNGIITGETGLGSAAKQAELDNPEIPYEDAIRAVDYLVFTNRRGNEGSGEEWYAFVDEIRYINQNVAEIRYTVDALLSFQKFFYLGRGMIYRDMQFEERLLSVDGALNRDNINYQAEPIEPDTTQYVFQHCQGETTGMQRLKLGTYDQTFCTSDVSLSADDIKSNNWITGLPSFAPALPLVMHYGRNTSWGSPNETRINLGLYYVSNMQNEAFKKLGQYNAFEHILYAYSTPHNIVQVDYLSNAAGSDGIYHVGSDQILDVNEYVNAEYSYRFPNYYDDSSVLTIQEDAYSTPDNSYTPLNIKTHYAPYNYFSVTDKQGNSLELPPQILNHALSAPASLFQFYLHFNLTGAPNILSSVYVPDILQMEGSIIKPLQTLWQIPTYVMTPNNSGYMLNVIQGARDVVLGVVGVAIGMPMAVSIGATAGATAPIYAAMQMLAPVAGGAMAGAAGATINNYSTISSTLTSFGTNAILQGAQQFATAGAKYIFGLPKAQGGLATGLTTYNMTYPGYEIYRVHLKTSLLRLIDTFFTRFGYAQNQYRYPHINIRRRWCFVQADNIDLIPLQANNYNRGGIPTEFRQQIIDRLKAGVTFWNVRRAIKGDDSDADPIGDTNWSQMSDIINCKFIKNYGSKPDSDEAKDNMSYTGGYCDYYTDDFQPAISP